MDTSANATATESATTSNHLGIPTEPNSQSPRGSHSGKSKREHYITKLSGFLKSAYATIESLQTKNADLSEKNVKYEAKLKELALEVTELRSRSRKQRSDIEKLEEEKEALLHRLQLSEEKHQALLHSTAQHLQSSIVAHSRALSSLYNLEPGDGPLPTASGGPMKGAAAAAESNFAVSKRQRVMAETSVAGAASGGFQTPPTKPTGPGVDSDRRAPPSTYVSSTAPTQFNSQSQSQSEEIDLDEDGGKEPTAIDTPSQVAEFLAAHRAAPVSSMPSPQPLPGNLAESKPKPASSLSSTVNTSNKVFQGYRAEPVVRNKDERDSMKAFACEQCAEFYTSISREMDRPDLQQHTCRHKRLHTPPKTPPDYWDVHLPDSQASLFH